MEILLWLVPPVLVTVVTMVWVGWLGREGRGLDREEAARRIGVALEREPRSSRRRAVHATDAGALPSGVVVRRRAPARMAPVEPLPERPAAGTPSRIEDHPERRAS